jgi:hypothetical protein
MRFKTLEFRRHECYGPCPVYSIKVHSNGFVEWHGEMFVKIFGETSWQISAQAVEDLGQALDDASFAQLKEKYDDYCMTDMSACTIAVELPDGKILTVYHYHGHFDAPKKLDVLEAAIDSIVGTKSYVGDKGFLDA